MSIGWRGDRLQKDLIGQMNAFLFHLKWNGKPLKHSVYEGRA